MDKYTGKVKELIDEYKYQLIFGLLICLVLIGVYYFINQSTSTPASPNKMNKAIQVNSNKNQVRSETKNNQPQQIFVDVKGAVLNPGVYQATLNMRGTDLVRMAGGFNEHADRNHVNLAKKVTDQEILYIPIQGEVTVLPVNNLESSESTANSDKKNNSEDKAGANKVNLNEADITKMQTISGVGQKKAEKIIDYRNQNGPFKTVDDLKNVPGFGEKTVANLKPSLSV